MARCCRRHHGLWLYFTEKSPAFDDAREIVSYFLSARYRIGDCKFRPSPHFTSSEGIAERRLRRIFQASRATTTPPPSSNRRDSRMPPALVLYDENIAVCFVMISPCHKRAWLKIIFYSSHGSSLDVAGPQGHPPVYILHIL